MRRSISVIFSVFILLGLAACGSDTSKGGNSNTGNGGAVENPSDIPVALWGALCDAVFTCPDVDPSLVGFLGRYPNAAACRADRDNGLIDLSIDQTQASIDEGRATYDAALANACVQKLRESLCSGGGFEEVRDCEDAFVGQVPSGGNCAQSQECADGSRCERSVEGQCYGTCEPSCGMTNCGNDEFCDTGEVCTARLSAGSDCFVDGMCQDGLVCSFDSETCVQIASEGGACQLASDCASGLQCFDGTCSSVEIKAPGEACVYSQAETVFCEPGSTCIDLMVTQTGTEGTCGPPKKEGEACSIFLECEAGLTCTTFDPSTEGTCAALFGNGETCRGYFDCQSGNCVDDTCAPAETDMICSVP